MNEQSILVSLDLYRQQSDRLRECAARLQRLRQTRKQLQSDQEGHQHKRSELLAAIVRKEPGGGSSGKSRAELEDLLQKLGVKQEICTAELNYTQDQLESQEVELQQNLMHVEGELHKLWRVWLAHTQQSETKVIEQYVHPEFRQQQRLMIEQLVMISQGVIECRKLEPTLHSMATTYLYDTPAYKFSEQRTQTVKMVEQETERILAQSEQLFSALERLLQLGLAIPAPQPFEFVAKPPPTEFPQQPDINLDDLMHYEQPRNLGTTLVPAPME